MTVIISHRIRQREFKNGIIRETDLRKILNSYWKGIGVYIKGEQLPKGSRLVKMYVTTLAGARRLVFLVDVESGDGFFLFYRDKNDMVGKNISLKNPLFRKELVQYLSILEKDIATQQFTAYEPE